ncbi:Pre-mRNA-splicing factor of RES complex-domain-containing protein [Coniella lustricola]|uniref:Pre-mRNA-splicing factor of RES complex-domain-containing protein n=1 Tax=Coniella lustricola TaxID=2025994 RepID=A0A2T3AKR2_9PEZI|nr:Pre-mRNA-splicing factor of RES complex-domain-containing protein [Coniella lustricola]
MLDVAYDGQDKVTPRVCTDYVVDPADWAPENRGREVSEERGRGAPPGSNTVEAILGTAVAGLRCEVCLQEAADCAGQFCIASFQALIVHNESVCCELRKVGPVEMGFGVFAKCAIPKDTPLSEYTGRLFPLDSRTSGSGTYDFVFAGSACCDASQYGTMSRFVNHHCVNYNLAVKDLMYGRRRVICYTTNRDIAPGEQLFVNYGNTYFNEARRCRCDSQTRPHLVEASFGEAQKDELVELTAKIDTIDHHSQIRPSPVTPWIKPWAEVKKTTKPREELARKAVADGVIDAKTGIISAHRYDITSSIMPSDLSSYLAEHYLTADPKPSSKKRKRKHDGKSSSSKISSGLLIQDDDDWGTTSNTRDRYSRFHNDEGNEEGPMTVGNVKEFRKTTKANWKTVGAANDGDAAAADAILASAAAEQEAARKAENDDDDPTIVDGNNANSVKMADGSHAGLQSAADVTAQLERRQREEREQFEAERRRAGLTAKQGTDEEETYYRDATGRRIDVSMKRAEARRAALEAEEKERAKEELLKGEVQLEEARKRKEALEDARGLTVARGADDEEMNRELKQQRRWNDPMARFLDAEQETTGSKPGTSSAGATDKTGKKAGRRPMYNGPAPPNRYGIRPGYRWDGVDRSNGFEAERFKAINRRERNKGLDYAWQMDE